MHNLDNPAKKQIIATHLSNQIQEALDRFPEATVAISLIDPAYEFYFHLNERRIFHAASLMKVPVMVEIYNQVSAGHISLHDEVLIRNRFTSIADGSLYSIEEDTDDDTYVLEGQPLTIEELIFRMITVSSNIATNLLLDIVGTHSISTTLEHIGVKHTRVLRGVEDLKAFGRGINNTITSEDMALILQALIQEKDISREHADAMINTMLRQTQNEMIPMGLPARTKVAHKTGQISKIHHDAGIIFPEKSSLFILVILIEGIVEHIKSAQIGAELTRLIYSIIRA